MITILIVAFCFLYTVTCWYSLRRHDQKERSWVRHPSKHGDDQMLY